MDDEEDDLFVFLQGSPEQDQHDDDEDSCPSATQAPLSKTGTHIGEHAVPNLCQLLPPAQCQVTDTSTRGGEEQGTPVLPQLPPPSLHQLHNHDHHHSHHPRSQSESSAAISTDLYSLFCNFSSSSSSLFDDLELISQSTDSQSVQLMETLLMQQTLPSSAPLTSNTSTCLSNYPASSGQSTHECTNKILPQLTADLVESELELELEEVEETKDYGTEETNQGKHRCNTGLAVGVGLGLLGSSNQEDEHEKRQVNISSSFTSYGYPPQPGDVIGRAGVQEIGTSISNASGLFESSMHSPCLTSSSNENDTETELDPAGMSVSSSSNPNIDDVTTVFLCSAINKCCQLDNNLQQAEQQQQQGVPSVSSVNVRKLLIEKLHRRSSRRRIHSDPTRPPTRLQSLHPLNPHVTGSAGPRPFSPPQVRSCTPSASLPTSSSPLSCSCSSTCTCYCPSSSHHRPSHTKSSCLLSLSTQERLSQEPNITTTTAPHCYGSDEINLSRTRCHRRVSGGNASGGGGGWSAAAAAMIQKRKERNRVSAAKCRDKQKKRYHNLETEKLSLSRDNEALLREVEQLERERKHLETMILTHSETCCDSICTPTIEALPPHPSHTDPLAHSPPVPASCPGSFIQTSILMASHSENNDDDTEMMTSRDDDS